MDSLHVYDVFESDYIHPELQEGKNIYFSLDFNNTREYLIQIYYRIKLLGNIAEYQFSHNVSGNEKLDKASFYLIAPVKMNVRKFNYIPNDTIEAGENIVYFWEMIDFEPKGSFEFKFRNYQ